MVPFTGTFYPLIGIVPHAPLYRRVPSVVWQHRKPYTRDGAAAGIRQGRLEEQGL